MRFMKGTKKSPVHSLVTRMAQTIEEKEQVYRLRYQVFVEENKNYHLQNPFGLEYDHYDPYSDHLMVVDEVHNQVVGTYRLLPGRRVTELGGLYSQSLFDLTNFTEYVPRTLELGRSCVDPAYRNGRVIQMLWNGVVNYLKRGNYRYIVGCVSLPRMELHELNKLYSMLVYKGIVTDRFQVEPKENQRIKGLHLISPEELDQRKFQRKLPPLLKGYQWLGAKIASEPIYDPLLRSIDFFVVLEVGKMTSRYQKRLMGK